MILLSAVVQPNGCRQQWPAVVLFLALRAQPSEAEGADPALHCGAGGAG